MLQTVPHGGDPERTISNKQQQQQQVEQRGAILGRYLVTINFEGSYVSTSELGPLTGRRGLTINIRK